MKYGDFKGIEEHLGFPVGVGVSDNQEMPLPAMLVLMHAIEEAMKEAVYNRNGTALEALRSHYERLDSCVKKAKSSQRQTSSGCGSLTTSRQ